MDIYSNYKKEHINCCKDYVLAGLETSYSLITKLALYTSRVYENKHHAFTSALTISIRVCVASLSPSLSCFLFSSLLLLSTLPLGSKSITRYSTRSFNCELSKLLPRDACGNIQLRRHNFVIYSSQRISCRQVYHA